MNVYGSSNKLNCENALHPWMWHSHAGQSPCSILGRGGNVARKSKKLCPTSNGTRYLWVLGKKKKPQQVKEIAIKADVPHWSWDLDRPLDWHCFVCGAGVLPGWSLIQVPQIQPGTMVRRENTRSHSDLKMWNRLTLYVLGFILHIRLLWKFCLIFDLMKYRKWSWIDIRGQAGSDKVE
jgi:hypothetical protein